MLICIKMDTLCLSLRINTFCLCIRMDSFLMCIKLDTFCVSGWMSSVYQDGYCVSQDGYFLSVYHDGYPLSIGMDALCIRMDMFCLGTRTTIPCVSEWIPHLYQVPLLVSSSESVLPSRASLSAWRGKLGLASTVSISSLASSRQTSLVTWTPGRTLSGACAWPAQVSSRPIRDRG